MSTNKELKERAINTIRMLSADGVEKANSGHPGLPMGAAAMAYVLWMQHMNINPNDPDWLNRDRFVLSAGHGSMLLYSLLHLTGYPLTLDDLKQFRQWDSLTPGHPEYGLTKGVETTTGPLGQGFATGVGMALAEKLLADRYNREGHEIIDYYTYGIVSDGDLMEGISAEAASYAGGVKLGKLIYLYDSNNITIEGSTRLAFCEDVGKRFESYGWHVEHVTDGNDIDRIDEVLNLAKQDDRPSLIIATTHIGFGSPNKQDTSGVHGAPLGADEMKATKENLNWPEEPFYIDEDVGAHFLEKKDEGMQKQEAWQKTFDAYVQAHPELAEELQAQLRGELPEGWDADLPTFDVGDDMASREASGKVMQVLAKNIPTFLGGSADLGPSNKTTLNDHGSLTCDSFDHLAKNMHYGVREHAMGAITNGLALSKAIRPFCSTFFIFSDYMRGAMRLSSIMELPVTYVLTHDSIGQGEDGMTHQPVEQLVSLRAMPNMTVIRPSDANETVEAWKYAMTHTDGPVTLVLSRQKIPTIDRELYEASDGLQFGAYAIRKAENPDLIMIATGSEVGPTLEAAERLAADDINAQVVSMPSWEIFENQYEAYKESILPQLVTKRMVIEAGSSYGWHKYIGQDGATVTVDTFGASAPGSVMMEKFGFTVDNIVAKAKTLF